MRNKFIGVTNLFLGVIILLFVIFFVEDKGWISFLSFIAGMNVFIFILEMIEERK